MATKTQAKATVGAASVKAPKRMASPEAHALLASAKTASQVFAVFATYSGAEGHRALGRTCVAIARAAKAAKKS
jgi:hypothetical protein